MIMYGSFLECDNISILFLTESSITDIGEGESIVHNEKTLYKKYHTYH